LAWCSVARSSFYYCPGIGLRGRKPYAVVKDKNGKIIDNEFIVKVIEQLFQHPSCRLWVLQNLYLFEKKTTFSN
jgi:hypothetical protein